MKSGKMRPLYLSLVIVMIVSMLAGCTASPTPTTVAAQPAAAQPAAAQPTDAAAAPAPADAATQPAAAPEREVKDEMVVILSGEPATLDPAKSNTAAIGNVSRFIMDGLFDLEPDGTYSTALIDTYELVDGLTLKIKLKSGIKFSDGTPLTAEDVLWNFVRNSKDPISKSQFVFLDEANSKVVDDENLVIQFNQAWQPYQDTMASLRGRIISKKAFEEMGEEKAVRNPIGTGPYKISEWVSGSYIKLVPNEYYWGTKPKMKQVTLKFVVESTARVIELETGAADIAFDIDGADIGRVDDMANYSIVQGPSMKYFLYTLSMSYPQFQDKNVRYAMSYAIDKEALVNASTDGVGTPISTFVPPLNPEGNKVFEDIPYDPEKAKELLAQAGYPDGFEIELFIEPDPLMARLAEAIQSMWSEIGIKANIVTAALATYTAQTNGQFQASIRSGQAQNISNTWIIYETSFGSRLNPNDEWLNTSLLDLRHIYPGDTKRTEALDAIADHLYDIRFSYPFMTMPMVYATSDNVEGFEFHPTPMNLDVEKWVVYK